MLRFLREAGKLKRLKRTGWALDGVREPESVAAHAWRAALMGLLLASKASVNASRLAAMLLVHDLAEARTGDLVTRDKEQYHAPAALLRYSRKRYRFVPLAEKRRREAAALNALLDPLGPRAKALRALIAEYNARTTRTAILAKDIDILELALQALEYEKAGARGLGHYFRHAADAVQTPLGKRLLKEILAARKR